MTTTSQSQWWAAITRFAETLHNDATRTPAAAWELRDAAEIALGTDIWLETKNLEIHGNNTPRVYATEWNVRQIDEHGGLNTDPYLNKLQRAANGSPIDAIAPLIAPWELHAALTRESNTTQPNNSTLRNAIIRWMPVHPSNRCEQRPGQYHALRPSAAATRRRLCAAAAGSRVLKDGFRVRRLGSGAALATAAAKLENEAVNETHVIDAARYVLVSTITAVRNDHRFMESDEAIETSERLSNVITGRTTSWRALPIWPARIPASNDASDDKLTWIEPNPKEVGDREMGTRPAAAAALARWTKPEIHTKLWRLAAQEPQTATALAADLPAMTEDDREEVLKRVSGLFRHAGGQHGVECANGVLETMEAGTRRAVTAHRRMHTIGCYLVELHPAAQQGPSPAG